MYKNIVNRHPASVAVVLFLIFAILLSLSSYALIDKLKNIEKTHAYESLNGIGKLKIGQIQDYLLERKEDALISAKFLSNRLVQQWLKNPSGKIPATVKLPLKEEAISRRFEGVLLLDSNINIRFSEGRYTGLSDAGKFIALHALHEKNIAISPIYFGDLQAPDKPLLDIFVPLEDPDTQAVMGILVLRDGLHSIFSLIQSWPAASKSSEVLLVTRDGNNVLFLNELRYKKDASLKFRLPINDSDGLHLIPTVAMLGNGYYGPLEAYDYRNKPVLAFNHPVPDTSWGLVAKIDTDEVLEHVKGMQAIIWVVSAFFVLGAGTILLMWFKKQKIEQLAHEQLARAAADLRISAIAFETHAAMLITDATPKIMRVNQAFQDITGYTAEEVIGRNPNMLSAPDLRKSKEFYEEMWAEVTKNGNWSGEVWDKRKDGVIYPKWLTITAVTGADGTHTNYVGSFFSITERKIAEDKIYRLAFFDALTNLPNRRLLLDRLQHALTTSARSGRHGAIMFIDLDNFKIINDTKGHDSGDLFLIEVAHRLQACVREGDTVARLGGDEFVVMLEDLGSQAGQAAAQAAEVGDKIRLAICEPCIVKDYVFRSGASIGISLFIDRVVAPEILLKNADIAMYQAKGAGRNAVRFFDPEMQAVLEAHNSMEMDLHHALDEWQFSLHYQAQTDCYGRIFGAETLLRWVHPQRGTVSPSKFIPIAEESSLILEIGIGVLDRACRQLALWSNDEQKCHLTLAVNVSARQFKMPEFVSKVATILATHRINPSRLKLELTESVVLENIDDIVAKMQALKALGVGLSMDDFGTGYSSLSYLKRMPLDQLKIDRSFVCDIATDPSDAILVKSIIDMAHNFHMDVIAEGVETEAQLDFLKRHGCLAFQGYLFSKPMPMEEFEALLSSMAVAGDAKDA